MGIEFAGFAFFLGVVVGWFVRDAGFESHMSLKRTVAETKASLDTLQADLDRLAALRDTYVKDINEARARYERTRRD